MTDSVAEHAKAQKFVLALTQRKEKELHIIAFKDELI